MRDERLSWGGRMDGQELVYSGTCEKRLIVLEVESMFCLWPKWRSMLILVNVKNHMAG